MSRKLIGGNLRRGVRVIPRQSGEIEELKKTPRSGTTTVHKHSMASSGGISASDFNDHSDRHENGGDDEISVAGLSGELADDQPPKVHGPSKHTEGTAWRLTYQNADGDETEIALGADGTFLESNGAAAAPAFRALVIGDLPANGKIRGIEFIIDGGGSEIADGIAGDVEIPFACTINAVTMLADQSGSIVVDIWKDTYANYPPTDADSITAAAVPTISAAVKSQDTTLTGWTTAIAAGNTLRYNVDSCSTITRCTICLKVTET